VELFLNLVKRDIFLAGKTGNKVIISLIFFLLILSIIPLSLGSNLSYINNIAAGIIWISIILSVLLSLDKLFQSDFDDGNLDLIMMINLPLELIVLAKCISLWLVTCVPIIIFSPIMYVFLYMDINTLLSLFLSLLIGTPGLILLGCISSALTIGVRRAGIVIAIIIIPLYIPFIIFGVSAINSGEISDMMFLSAMSLIAIVIGPVFSSFALKIYYR